MCACEAFRSDTRIYYVERYPRHPKLHGLTHSPPPRRPATLVCVRTVEQAGTRLCGMRAPTMCAWRAMRADTRMQKARTDLQSEVHAERVSSRRLSARGSAASARILEPAGTRLCGKQAKTIRAWGERRPETSLQRTPTAQKSEE